MKRFFWLVTFSLLISFNSCTNSKKPQKETPAYLSAKIHAGKSLVLQPKVWQLGLDSGKTVYDYDFQPGNSNVL